MKNKKGYTLVELIVVFALTALLMTAAAAVMSSFMRIFTRVQNTAHAYTVADTLLELVDGELTLAAAVPCRGGDVPADQDQIYLYISADARTLYYVDKEHIPIVMKTGNDGLLHLEYQSIAGEEPTDWYLGQGVYSGYLIESCEFSQKAGSNVVEITLTIKNQRTGYRYTGHRFIECYNLLATDIGTLS